jgi:rare lipoprotein A
VRGGLLFLIFVGAFAASAEAKQLPARYGYGRVAAPDAQVLDLRGLLPKGPDSGPLLPPPAKAKASAQPAFSQSVNSNTPVATCYDVAREGQQTAAGEVYDPIALSASHPDMPLSSLALMTNLKTGKEVIVRVNDRPASGAAMDVSPAAAEALGAGDSCRVQVAIRRLGAAPYAAPGGRPYRQPATQANLTSLESPTGQPVITFVAPAPAAPAPIAASVAYTAGGFLVQVGAYSQRANAEAARARAGSAGPASIETAVFGEVSLYRVRLGPWGSRQEAEQARIAAEALGFAGAKITTP